MSLRLIAQCILNKLDHPHHDEIMADLEQNVEINNSLISSLDGPTILAPVVASFLNAFGSEDTKSLAFVGMIENTMSFKALQRLCMEQRERVKLCSFGQQLRAQADHRYDTNMTERLKDHDRRRTE